MSNEMPRTLTEEWKWRRREAIIRDSYACQDCGARGGLEGDVRLEVHHIQPVAKGGGEAIILGVYHQDKLFA
jgi:5-methylcytosine-specific restriction endonuclease McrA